ncbi:MAG: helix-turn-helix domain-containing protein [Gemmatimonadaceae bacterium]
MSNPIVAGLLHAADARACVVAGAHAWFAVRHHTSIGALHDTLRTEHVALVIIDAADAQCRSLAPAIATIRQGFPTVPVLAYCAIPAGRSSVVVDAVRAGATGLVLRGIDDVPTAMRAAIQAARRTSVVERVEREVALHLPTAARPLLRYAVTRLVDEPSVQDAAASLGVDRKTLVNWLKRSERVGPRKLINWVRLAIVVGMLEDPGRTVEQASLEVGFASATAFRNMLQRYTGFACADIRGNGGLARVLAPLSSALGQETNSDKSPAIPMSEAEMRVLAASPGA